MRARRDVLRRMRADGSRIIRLEEEASQARVDLSDAEGQLRDLEADLADAPEGTEEIITRLIDEHAQTNIALNNTRSRLKATGTSSAVRRRPSRHCPKNSGSSAPRDRGRKPEGQPAGGIAWAACLGGK